MTTISNSLQARDVCRHETVSTAMPRSLSGDIARSSSATYEPRSSIERKQIGFIKRKEFAREICERTRKEECFAESEANHLNRVVSETPISFFASFRVFRGQTSLRADNSTSRFYSLDAVCAHWTFSNRIRRNVHLDERDSRDTDVGGAV